MKPTKFDDDPFSEKKEWTDINTDYSVLYRGEFADKMMRKWKKNFISLEENFKTSLMDSAWGCKDNIRQLSIDLLDQLKYLEQHLSEEFSEESVETGFIERWMSTIKEWKRNVFEIKCSFKIYLTDLIRKHCDLLLKLDQYHPEYVKWKISHIIRETNKIIEANEEAFEKTELGLIQSITEFLKKKRKTHVSKDESVDIEEHDAINVNYDDFELEEEKKRKGEILIEPMEEIRTDSTFKSLEDWLTRLRETLSQPLPTFNNYDVWNSDLQTALDHMENCKEVVLGSAIEFIDVIQPHLRDELAGISQSNIDLLTPQERSSIERWMECISVFEFLMQRTIRHVMEGAAVWNQHVCRLETVRKVIQNILRDMLTKQNQQQIKIELKINVLLDNISEAPNKDELESNVKGVQKLFTELEKLFSRGCETGLAGIKDFSIGCKIARQVFCCQAMVCLAKEFETIDFPDHGSEQDVTIDPIMDLHHWEVIKQTFNSYANWHLGLVEGINMLCQVERDRDNWERIWEEGLIRHLVWIKEIKEQALNRRKERFHADLVLPRTRELEAHNAILLSHIQGLEKVFAERSDWIDDFKCVLLSMANKLLREYEAIVNYKNINDIYSRNRFLRRIHKFETELQKTDDKKTLLFENELQKIKKKFMWLQKANHRILSCIRLFNEGGSFSPSEALEFSDKVNKLQADLIKEEKATLEAFSSVAKSINPTKNIDPRILSGIKQMIHYKTKKDSAEEIADTILSKLKESIEEEMSSAKNLCSKLCDVIGCTEAPLETLQELFAKLSMYLSLPPDFNRLECEDFAYMQDFIEESVESFDETNLQDDDIDDEEDIVEKDDGKRDCKELLAEAAAAEINKGKGGKDKANDGKRVSIVDKKEKKSKKNEKDKTKSNVAKDNEESDEQALLAEGKKKGHSKRIKNKDSISVERKNVLRDTKCEQERRKKLLKEMEKNKKNLNGDEDDEEEGDGRRRSKTKKKSKKKGSTDMDKRKHDKDKESLDRDKRGGLTDKENEQTIVLDGGFLLDFAGSFLFRYTRLPIETTVCNYLVITKKNIFEHFVQIQRISEKFILSEQADEIKKVWQEYSPRDDFEVLIRRVLKSLRILNIFCEHSWILLVHDFLCMQRALHCVTEERVGKELNELEYKWKSGFSKICCESEASLKHVVLDKTRRAARLVNKFTLVNCQDSEWGTLHQDVTSHCNQHVDDIKNIWSDYTKGLNERYLEFKNDFEEFSERTEDMRNDISSENTIWTFFKDLQGFATRFDSAIKLLLDEAFHEGLDEEIDLTQLEFVSQNINELDKVKMLQLIIEVILSVIENFEINYSKRSLTEGDSTEKISVAAEAMVTTKVDIQRRRNLFLQEIARNIKFKHGCFRKLCTDQIGITIKWLDQWQNKNQMEATPEQTKPIKSEQNKPIKNNLKA